jgi:large subunit ribosomal protein L32
VFSRLDPAGLGVDAGVFDPIQRRGDSCRGLVFHVMANPKRKQSKRRSALRRGANRFKAPQLSKDSDGTAFLPHRVNPANGMYRGRQVLDIET